MWRISENVYPNRTESFSSLRILRNVENARDRFKNHSGSFEFLADWPFPVNLFPRLWFGTVPTPPLNTVSGFFQDSLGFFGILWDSLGFFGILHDWFQWFTNENSTTRSRNGIFRWKPIKFSRRNNTWLNGSLRILKDSFQTSRFNHSEGFLGLLRIFFYSNWSFTRRSRVTKILFHLFKDPNCFPHFFMVVSVSLRIQWDT